MGRALATVACVAIATMLSGCLEHVGPRVARSLKDDAPKSEHSATDRGSLIDRAKAEQAARCGERHIEHGNGTLKETVDQKRVADASCAELHKYDYVH